MDNLIYSFFGSIIKLIKFAFFLGVVFGIVILFGLLFIFLFASPNVPSNIEDNNVVEEQKANANHPSQEPVELFIESKEKKPGKSIENNVIQTIHVPKEVQIPQNIYQMCVIYAVRSGDTIHDICRRFKVNRSEVRQIFYIKNPREIRLMNMLLIPYKNYQDSNCISCIIHTVGSNDTIQDIARRYRVSPQEILKITNVENPKAIYPGYVLRFPVS